MLPLDAELWTTLRHAYGTAEDIPLLLRQLRLFPPSRPDAEPWHSLWSALCHQGDVYSASFAAVPHIVDIGETAPSRVGFDLFLLPAAIDVARVAKSVTIPPALQPAYSHALSKLPALACAVIQPKCDGDLCQSALAACAVAAGRTDLARLLIDLDSDDIGEVLEWYESR